MGQLISENWIGLVDIIQTIIAILALLIAAGIFVRHKREVKELLYVEQERDDFRKKHAQLEVRLDKIDPERFIDRANELRDKGNFEELEKAAVGFAEKQTEAFGLAAEVLTEQRILDSEEHGKGAIEEALRFSDIGLAARPNSKRLEKLKSLATSRAAGIERGEPIEALNMDGMTDLELNSLSHSLTKAGKYELAEIAARRCVPLVRFRDGIESKNYVRALGTHADSMGNLGAYEEAEPVYREAVAITKTVFEKSEPEYATSLNNLAALLKLTGRFDEAEPLYREAMLINEEALGTAHPDYATSLNNLAGLLDATGRVEKAESLFHQAIDIQNAALGNAHPDYARSLNNLAELLKSTERLDEAEPLYREALAIQKTALGEVHPIFATTLHNLALLLAKTERYNEALPLMEQALMVWEEALGTKHPKTEGAKKSLAELRKSVAN